MSIAILRTSADELTQRLAEIRGGEMTMANITTTTFEDVQDNNGRAIRILEGTDIIFSGGVYAGCTVHVMAYDVSEAEEKILNDEHRREFRTAHDISPMQAYTAALEYASALCTEMSVPLIDDAAQIIAEIGGR